MKKIYSQPELELLVLTEDIVSTSGVTKQHTFEGFTSNAESVDWVWQD